jgi:phosphoribosylformylglycinamidine synthase PurS subunit
MVGLRRALPPAGESRKFELADLSLQSETSMKARVTVTLKSGILDPQGKAIEGALRSLGVEGVASVRQGKVFDIELEGSDPKQAETLLKQAADKLLANTVIENYRVEVTG